MNRIVFAAVCCLVTSGALAVGTTGINKSAGGGGSPGGQIRLRNLLVQDSTTGVGQDDGTIEIRALGPVRRCVRGRR